MWMNTWEIDMARARHSIHPILGPATQLLSDLRDLANENSDGWCFWPKPARAAAKLMTMIQHPETANEATFKAAQRPIKAFCTRHKLPYPLVTKGLLFTVE